MNNSKCSTGIEFLDNLIGGIQIGDNLVWETDAGAYVDLFVDKFTSYSLNSGGRLIYVSFNKSPVTIAKRLSHLPSQKNITILDCFTSGKGEKDSAFTRFYETDHDSDTPEVIWIENPGNVGNFTGILNKLEEEKGEGTAYIFDSITGMQSLWGDEAKTYKFFTYACPRLYELNTIAYWILERGAHTPSFKANLEHITQIAMEVSQSGGQLFLKINKSEKRYSPNMFKPHKFEVWDDEIIFREAAEKEVLDLGGKVKSLRTKRGLTQSELGQKMGVTASYISQLERNLVSPSIDSLLQLISELHIDPSYFFSSVQSSTQKTVYNKGMYQEINLSGIKESEAEFLLLTGSPKNRRLQSVMVTIQPGTEIPQHIFDHKGDEYIYVIKGELEFTNENGVYILREGDSAYLDSLVPTEWRNMGEVPAQALWVLSPPVL
ncbi:cupin domain-containing protein [Candidatus Poribacteria bacterium]|nr:cupin domain-containing protein [Candidatus Poribacteria bacterium]